MNNDSEKLLAEVLLTLKSMMSELCALRARIEGHPGISEGWMRSAEAGIALKSEGVLGDRHLRKLLKEGVFSVNRGEIRNVSKGDRPTWEYNIPACRKALQRYFKKI